MAVFLFGAKVGLTLASFDLGAGSRRSKRGRSERRRALERKWGSPETHPTGTFQRRWVSLAGLPSWSRVCPIYARRLPVCKLAHSDSHSACESTGKSVGIRCWHTV